MNIKEALYMAEELERNILPEKYKRSHREALVVLAKAYKENQYLLDIQEEMRNRIYNSLEEHASFKPIKKYASGYAIR